MIPTSPSSPKDGQSPDSSTKPVVITESTDPMGNPPPPRITTTPRSTHEGSGGRGEFRPLPFLYRTLLGIFVVEALFIGFSFQACMKLAMTTKPPKTVQEHCPRLGERAENLFGISIATVLSLMTGQAVENFKKKKD